MRKIIPVTVLRAAARRRHPGACPALTVRLGVAAARLGLSVACLGLAHAGPVTKAGECGPFTRYNAPGSENWTQFPVKPNPISEFPIGTVQDPLTPQQSANCIEVPDGLKLELWASEEQSGNLSPGLAYIQHFTFDERGRIWAVEPRSYPNTFVEDKFDGGPDRILILEDTDGDRVMDKVKVFKDGLNMPQGIEVVNGGVVVAMAPYLVFFPDRGDTAGTPQILWTNERMAGPNFVTIAGFSNLMYGLDNWIYGHSGYNACAIDGQVCGDGRVWRFRHTALGHDSTRFETWTTGGSNAWGVGQAEDGQIFQSRTNGFTTSGHISHSLRRGGAAVDIRDGAYKSLIYPITGDRRLWEGSTGKGDEGWLASITTSVTGMQLYTSRLFPRKYWNRFAFVCDNANKLCNQDSLVVSGSDSLTGSTWRAVRLPGPARANLFASRDAWVAPILAKTGPDGAVWVLDWYNYLNLHNPALPSGEGGGWLNHLREKSRVRIWRVTPADGSTEPILDLSQASQDQLLAAFGNPNFHWRLQAQRLLLAKGWSAALGERLRDILEDDRSVDPLGNNPRVVHALWTLHGLGRLAEDTATWNPVVGELLRHPAWGVRRNALLALPRTAASARIIGANCSVNDPHGHVRLQALAALTEIPGRPAGLPAMWDRYRDVDSHAALLADSIRVAEAATLPCEPALHAPSGLRETAPPRTAGRAALPRNVLRFVAGRTGLRLLPHGGLPSGELRVYDLRGRIAFRSAYQAGAEAGAKTGESAGMGRWSVPEARGLGQAAYAYVFVGADGSLIRGSLAPAGGL